MTLSARLFSSFAAVLLLATACGQPTESTDSSTSTQSEQVSTPVPAEIQALTQSPTVMMCDHNTAPGVMHCYARKRTDIGPQSIGPNATPSGLGPSDIKSAYALPSTGGTGLTVAIVDSNDDPTAEADLAKYRSTYGLPACTTANGCFKKVNQDGNASPLPATDTGWAGEIALDLDMVSAACPNCKILLVEANTADMDNLGAAVNTAARLGAAAISNSYGGSEDSTIATADSTYFNHPGITITVSSGDDGYGVEYPASSQYVTAVGGTSLTKSSTSRGWTESVWGSSSNTNGGAGSGCSAYITKPSWQHDTGCAKRMVADVSAVADPNTGVAVYDTTGGSGWAVYGGTSASSPLVAAIYTLTGHATNSLGYSYSNTSAYFDVTSGTNGSCGSTYQCKAGTGYDGPTGNGTPNGSVLASGGGTTTNDFSLSLSPTSRSTGPGTTTTFTVATALVSGTAQTITLSVSGLPSGVTGSFSPTSVTAGSSSTLTLTVASGAAASTSTLTISGAATSGSHTTTGSLTITSAGGSCTTNSQLLLNPGFESTGSWTTTSGVISATSSSAPSHSGSYLAYLDDYGTTHTDTAYQTVTIPSGACTASLSFWLRVTTSETTTTTAYDTLTVQIQNSSGTALATLATYSNLNKSSSYAQKTFDVSAYKGQTIRVYFKGVEDSTQATGFLIDDTALNITQ